MNMFLLGLVNLLLSLLELGAVVGVGIYGYRDYRRGWPGARALGEKAVELWERFGIGPQRPVKRARRIVRAHARNLAQLQQAVARVAATIERAELKETGQLKLAADCRLLVDEAYRQEAEGSNQALVPFDATPASTALSKVLPQNGSGGVPGMNAQKVAVLAARGAAEAEIRAQMHRKTAERQQIVFAQLQEKLSEVEAEFEALRTEAETIEVSADVAEADRQLYALISEVSATTGLTPRGELSELVEDTETSRIEAATLVEMVRRSNVLDTLVKGVQVSAAVAGELEASKQRVRGFLSAMTGSAKNGDTGDTGDTGETDAFLVADADYYCVKEPAEKGAEESEKVQEQ